MNWIRFALYVSAVYFTYYGAMIFWDFIRSTKIPGEEVSHELSFAEQTEPVQEIPDDNPQVYNSSILSSGGVSLKQLFSLAREEAIEFTRPVSF